MQEPGKLQQVTAKLLQQVEEALELSGTDLSKLKQAAGVLKDIRDVQKELNPVEQGDGCIRVSLEGEVADYAG